MAAHDVPTWYEVRDAAIKSGEIPMSRSCLWIPVALVAIYGCEMGGSGNLLNPGAPAPPLRAPEWVGGAAPSAASLAGKVVVVDVWAHW
jgi:hypothetical protein